MGAVAQAVSVNSAGTFNATKTVWAAGAGVKLNLPMIAAGDALYLNGGYADGMTEYTINWTSFKSSDTRRNVGGYVVNHPSWIAATVGGVNKLETVKSWNLAGLYSHFWTPQHRTTLMATYGQVEGTTASKAMVWGASGAFGDAKVWNVGMQQTWLASKDFEIGLEAIYSRVNQDVRRFTTGASATGTNPNTLISNTTVTKENLGNWTGRLRVERTF
jgi:hypothetical protein